MTRPRGKTMAATVLIRPGALSWYQGAVLVMSDTAAAKARRAPAMKELKKILSMRMLALYTPARDTSSIVSLGEYELIVETIIF